MQQEIISKMTMKKWIELAFLCTAIFTLSGCTTLEKATGWAFEQDVQTQIVDGKEVTSTNWVVKPSVENGLRITGSIVPGAGGLVSEGIIAALAAFAAYRGRKWKKAAIDAVDAGQKFRKALDKSNAKGKIPEIVDSLKIQQKTNKTFDLIKTILNKI